MWCGMVWYDEDVNVALLNIEINWNPTENERKWEKSRV